VGGILKIVSFNINGLRARYHQLQALVEKHDPDIIGLQETKVHDSEFPHDQLKTLGYHIVHHGQKAHYGVATLSRWQPLAVMKGYPNEDPEHQRRTLITAYQLSDGTTVKIVNGYFPQGESRHHPVKFPHKRDYYENLNTWLTHEADPEDQLLVLGDLNVAPTDADIGIGEENAKRWLRSGKCSFLPEERSWYEKLYSWGLQDTWRTLNPAVSDQFSWFDYRSRGFEASPRRGLRIDMILATRKLQQRCINAGIDYELRSMEKPSDHCPIWAEFAL